MPALSRKNSGEEVEGQKKNKNFIGKEKLHVEKHMGILIEALGSLNPF